FLPAIPAYLWVWPNLEGAGLDVFQTVVYLYVIAGTVWIGRRRWSWEQLGVNRKGLWLALGCTLALLAARLLIILGIDWNIGPPQIAWWGLAGRLLFYFGLVGVGEGAAVSRAGLPPAGRLAGSAAWDALGDLGLELRFYAVAHFWAGATGGFCDPADRSAVCPDPLAGGRHRRADRLTWAVGSAVGAAGGGIECRNHRRAGSDLFQHHHGLAGHSAAGAGAGVRVADPPAIGEVVRPTLNWSIKAVRQA
ncbi:MAG TPA: hypothetical protein VLM83_02455, partial [Anaerolineales bacterium]|nr:hypothetical protein [Anaerolineales bacterium]